MNNQSKQAIISKVEALSHELDSLRGTINQLGSRAFADGKCEDVYELLSLVTMTNDIESKFKKMRTAIASYKIDVAMEGHPAEFPLEDIENTKISIEELDSLVNEDSTDSVGDRETDDLGNETEIDFANGFVAYEIVAEGNDSGIHAEEGDFEKRFVDYENANESKGSEESSEQIDEDLTSEAIENTGRVTNNPYSGILKIYEEQDESEEKTFFSQAEQLELEDDVEESDFVPIYPDELGQTNIEDLISELEEKFSESEGSRGTVKSMQELFGIKPKAKKCKTCQKRRIAF